MYKVKKRTLLMIAGVVWLIAGFNVARLGILSYLAIEQRWYWYVLSVVIFTLFGLMFFRMSQKHTKRIMDYEEERQPFRRFFDLKAYIIMAVMMGGGIGLRAAGVFPVGYRSRMRARAGGRPVYPKIFYDTEQKR